MPYIYKDDRGRYRIQYTDAAGKRRDVKGFSDKNQTRLEAARIEDKVIREKRGIYDHAGEAAVLAEEKSLATHIIEWEASIVNAGTGADYAIQQRRRVHDVLCDRLEYQRLSQIETGAVQGAVKSMMDTEVSQQTAAHYIQALKQFGRWLYKPARRVREPLLDELVKYTVSKQARPRSAFTADEIIKLVAVTKASKEYRFTMSGPDRAMAYLLAVVTGFRRNELRSLTPGSFNSSGTVVLAADATKNRKAAVVMLPDWVVKEVGEWLKSSMRHGGAILFPLPEHSARMMRKDLVAAGISLTPSRDFHCLRHTAITNWVRSAKNFKVAQELARHSDPKLTMRYTHTTPVERSDLVKVTAAALQPKTAPALRSKRRTKTNTDKSGQNTKTRDKLGKGKKGGRNVRKTR